jgi:hypothetical protein
MSDWLDISNDMLERGEEQLEKFEKGSNGFQEGEIHDAKIRLAYLITSEKNATGLVIELEKDNGQRDSQTFWVRSGDEKGNKSYYEKKDEKTGNMIKYPMPGIVEANRLLKAVGTSINEIKPEDAVIEVFGKKEQHPTFKELIGKRLKVGVQKQESEWEGKIYINSVFTPLPPDASEEEIEKVLKKVSKTPVIKIRTNKKNSNSSNSEDDLDI